TLRYESLGSVSGLVAIEGRDVTAREPRALTVRGRQELHGRTVNLRFRYAVVDDPPRPLKVAFDRSVQGIPFDGFEDPALFEAGVSAAVQGHRIPPGRTKVFKAAMEPRLPDEPSTLDRVLQAPAPENFLIKPADQDARDVVADQVAAYQGWFDANVP